MKRIFPMLFLILFGLCGICSAQISVDSFVTADDVTIDHLEDFRETVVDAINSADGALLQTASITADKLDANANPENRWDEAFSDFVFTGLTTPTSASLSSTTASGTAYILGTRVVKDPTANTYTASRWTFVDLSNNGTYTYQETAVDASEPTVATNSIRLSRVSTDTTTVLEVRDDRTTSITVAIGSASSIADTDTDTMIQTQESDDEDIIRIDLGDTTLTAAREVLTIQAIDASDVKIEPTTDDDVDLGSATKQFKDVYIDGTAEIDTLNADAGTLTTIDINGGSMDGVNIGTTTATGELIVNDSSDDANGLGAQGTSGQVLTSAGAGVNPTFGNVAIEFVSKTTIGANSNNSGDIAITQGVKYLVIVEVNNQGESAITVHLRFNSDSGSSYGNSTEAKTASGEIDLFASTFDPASAEGSGVAIFTMSPFRTDQMIVRGESVHIDGSANVTEFEVTGFWNADAAVTSFEIISLVANMNGNSVLLYKYNES